MQDFLSTVQQAGLPGLWTGIVVLVIVFALSYLGVIVTGDQKRTANVIASILLAGVNLLNPQDISVITAAIASILSALIYELVKFSADKLSVNK